MTTHEQLVAELAGAGLLPVAWADAFAAVDRGTFVPRRCWFDGADGHPQPLDRDTEPDSRHGAVYSDEPIVTQLDAGTTSWPDTSPMVTSSASQPGIVLGMLDALNAHPGMRVLEIGTGTGYNAALLAHRLGDEQVTSIEVDPLLTEQARSALAAAEFPVRQYGPRRLWEEAGAAHAWWVANGRPSRTRYGLTVTAEHQQVWLDEPGNTVTTARRE